MIKRFFDIVISFIGLVILMPAFVFIAMLIWLDSSGSIFFRQQRVGKMRKPFRIFKFRTMVENAESSGKITVADDPRITRIGFVLRKYKLDELPQLLNVFVGDMSFVGPRPEVPEYSRCLPEQDKVFSVRPGITDPASMQFSKESELLDGAGDISAFYVKHILPEKVKCYCNYIENRSLYGDFKIILSTLALAASAGSQKA